MKRLLLIALICTSANAETFKCVTGGHTTYSSSPCGSNSVPVQSRVSIGGHETVPIILEDYTPPNRQLAPQQQVVQRQKVVIDCSPHEAALESIRSRMRAGYSGRESAYLHARQQEAMVALDNCQNLQKQQD
jgi:hypothetical protein